MLPIIRNFIYNNKKHWEFININDLSTYFNLTIPEIEYIILEEYKCDKIYIGCIAFTGYNYDNPEIIYKIIDKNKLFKIKELLPPMDKIFSNVIIGLIDNNSYMKNECFRDILHIIYPNIDDYNNVIIKYKRYGFNLENTD